MDIDLSNLSRQELLKLQRDIDKAIATFEERSKREALAELEARAKELGFSLSSLVGVSAPKTPKTRKAASAKYAHPENPSITWSGRGRKPQWFADAIANGKTPESMSV